VPRAPRIEVEGGIHHITLRGNRGQTIFRDGRDYSFFLARLDGVARGYRWMWLSYCLMSNHCHLVVQTPETTLGRGMRQLAGTYAQAFNRRHGTYGHLFQERYGSVLVGSDSQLVQLLRYVALNPVKAGMCAEASEWRWSSHRMMLQGKPRENAARVEALLEAWGREDGGRYAALFEGELEATLAVEAVTRPPLEELLARPNLDDAMRTARDHGYRVAEIAAAVGLHKSNVSRRIRREQQRN
jgi:REP element-mobilizing transposase RayT